MRSIRDQIELSYRAHWVLSILVAAFAALFVVAGWIPSSRQLARLREDIQVASRRLEINQARAVNLPVLTLEVARLDGELQRFNKKLPRTAEVGEFIRDLTQFSQQYSLRKLVHQPGQIRRLELYSEIPITMNFEGDFVSVYNFLRQMEEMPRLTRIRSLQVKCRDIKHGQVDVNMAMNIYFSEM